MRPDAIPPSGPVLAHVTAQTGHVRFSPRSEVKPHVLAGLGDLLRVAVHTAGPVALRSPGDPWTFTATRTGSALSADVLAPDGRAVACLAVGSDRSPEARAAWWAVLERCPHFIGPNRPEDLAAPPEGRWVFAALLDPIRRHPAAVPLVADFSRCLAWAFLDPTEGAG